jgi:hypothetical protein
MIEAILSRAERFGVLVRFVDPRFTSITGWVKFNHLGLNPDTAAAFAIARKGILSKKSDETLVFGKKGKDFVEVARRMEKCDANDRVGRMLAHEDAKKAAEAENARLAQEAAAAFFGQSVPKRKSKSKANAEHLKHGETTKNGSPKGQASGPASAADPQPEGHASLEDDKPHARSSRGSDSEWARVAKMLGRGRKRWAARLKAACPPGKMASRTKRAGATRPGASSEKRQGEPDGGRAVPGGGNDRLRA